MKKITIFFLCLIVSSIAIGAENPHGKLKFGCETCHNVTSFENMSFDHSLTGYELQDRHKNADCKGCHDIADFSKVKSNCLSCHTDIHKTKMGNDCQNCHSPKGWEQFDIQEMHATSNFPISGKHALVDCESCHTNMPSGDFSFNTTRCISCHQTDYLAVNSPNHALNGFSTDCESCHQMDLWRPALFDNHDILFPIFSGTHKNEWDDCRTCHTNPTNYQEFSCLNCHEHAQSKADPDHNGINGYAYNSPDCYFCHPTGKADDFKDHDAQFFPIYSGVHNAEWTTCNECHVNPTNRKDFDCLSCHLQQDTDPTHTGMLGYNYNSPDCYLCHPTGEKGIFVDHDPQFFPIYSGTHNNQWDDCTQCHTTPNDRSQFSCLSCHLQPDTDPVHTGMTGYSYNSADCYLCHPTGTKGQFAEHDAQFFPIYSGTHNNQWDDCVTCHTTPTDRAQFSCLSCHLQPDTDPTHSGITGYNYSSPDCYFCHPTGEKGQFVDHDAQFFPIFSGTHNNQWDECASCHTNPKVKSEFSCLSCHLQPDTDPVHSGISGYNYNSTDCYFCHPTGEKGQFVDHDAQFFPIYSGTHNNEWSNCNECHTNPNNKAEVSCLGCHLQTPTNDMHGDMNGYVYASPNCISCHPTGQKGTFTSHDAEFFPIFSGSHRNEWNSCVDCHTTPTSRLTFSCFKCHSENSMNSKHQGRSGYAYDSNLCYSCHPNGRH